MQNYSEQAIDDLIECSLRYEGMVSAAQKQRAWERLRTTLEAQGATDSPCREQTEYQAVAAVAQRRMGDAIFETTPCCDDNTSTFLEMMRRVSDNFSSTLELSARFLFASYMNELMMRPGYMPLYRQQIVVLGSFRLASA